MFSFKRYSRLHSVNGLELEGLGIGVEGKARKLARIRYSIAIKLP